jgi:hypothetical protein
MTTGSPPGEIGNPGLARQLTRAGRALLVIFAITVLLSLFPPRLLEPAWQLQTAASLATNGTMALLGFLLYCIAGWLDPENVPLQGTLRRLKRLTKLAVIGYLLLIPLQGFGLWRAFDGFSRFNTDQLRGAQIRLDRVSKAVESSRSTAELQVRLRQLPGAPLLSEAQMALPMEQIRQRFRAASEQSRTRLNAGPAEMSPVRAQQAIKESVRVVIASLALALAFRTSAQARTRAPLQLDRDQELFFEASTEQKEDNPDQIDERQLYP